jgi:hypothetical protein
VHSAVRLPHRVREKMNFIKLLVLLGIAGGGYHYWKQRHEVLSPATVEAATASENGFIAMPPVAGQNRDAILVVAAENCPHEDAQRADSLAEDLSRKGVPVVRTHSISFDLAGPDSSMVEHINAVMQGSLPIVFVHGRAKPNPTLDEVVAEYQGAAR